MNKRIYLVRHGDIALAGEKRYIGITDLPLSAMGVAQGKELGRYFADIPLEKVYSSPLQRCMQTASLLLEGKNIGLEVVKELEEIHLGSWENQSVESIKQQFYDQYRQRGEQIESFCPPGGESFALLQERVLPAYERIVATSKENALIVTHAGVIRVILCRMLDYPLKDLFKIQLPYGCVCEVVLEEQEHPLQCKRINMLEIMCTT